jgi:hypothetical protein
MAKQAKAGLALAAIVISGLTSAAHAGPDSYCDGFARDLANRKTGISTGAVTTDEKWRASYDKAFAGCMDNYAPQEAEAAADPPPVKKSGKPKPGTRAWADYCASHYRSYDPDTGKYKSYSGEMRPCR